MTSKGALTSSRSVTSLAVMVVLLATSLVAGQQPGQINISALQNRSETPNKEQQEQINQWISDNLDDLAEAVGKLIDAKQPSEEDNVGPDLPAIRQKIIKAAKGSENYTRVFVPALGQQVVKRIQSAEKVVSLNLTMLLAQVKDPQLVQALLELAGNKSVMVRYWALKGLAQTDKGVFPDNSQISQDQISTLVQLSKQEQVPMVLGLIYRVLDRPDNELASQGLLQIIEQRVTQHPGSKAKAISADLWAIRACENLYPLSENQQQMRILTLLAGMFKAVVDQYCNSSPVPPVQYHLERLARQLEQTLSKLTGTNRQGVWEALTQTDKDSALTQLAQWVGSDQTQGILNKPPYSIPVPKMGSGDNVTAE